MKDNIYEYRFGKFPQTKYNLYVDNVLSYSFVTTCRPEEECIDLMHEKAKAFGNRSKKKNYKICSKTKDGEKIVAIGKIPEI